MQLEYACKWSKLWRPTLLAACGLLVLSDAHGDDYCTSAQTLSTCVPVQGTTIGVADEVPPAEDCFQDEVGVWYTWTPLESGRAAVQLIPVPQAFPFSFEPALNVFSSCTADTKLACDFDSDPFFVTFDVVAGTEYVIRVSSIAGFPGDFTIEALVGEIDEDDDGLTLCQELDWGLDPTLADSDGDGLEDLEEVAYDGDATAYKPYHPITNPSGIDLDATSPNTDGDAWTDFEEIYGEPLNPLKGPVVRYLQLDALPEESLIPNYFNADVGDDFEPVIRAGGNGVWLTLWSSDEDLDSSGFDADILCSISTDSGATWGQPEVVNSTAFADSTHDFMPTLAYCGNSRWVAGWISDTDVSYAVSTDDGATWSAAGSIAFSDDAAEPFIHSDGLGHLVATWSDLSTTRIGYAVFTAYSSDNGDTWSAWSELPSLEDDTTILTPQVAADGSGDWMLAWAELANTIDGYMAGPRVAVSHDHGQTWSVEIEPSEPISPFDPLFAYPATDGNGTWMVHYNSTDAVSMVIISSDDLATFQPPRRVDALPKDFQYATGLWVDNDRIWVASWLQVKQSGTFEQMYSTSGNAGQSWSQPRAFDGADFSVDDAELSFRLATDGEGTWVGVWPDGCGCGGSSDLLMNAFDVQAFGGLTVALSSAISSPTNRDAIIVNVEFNRPVTGFTAADLSVLNATISSFKGSGQSYTFKLRPSSQGSASAEIAEHLALDGDGARNEASNLFSIVYDTIAPTVVFASTLSGTTNQSAIPVTIQFSEDVVGFSPSHIVRTNATKSNFSGSGSSYSFDLNPTGQGEVTSELSAATVEDAAGNKNVASNLFSIQYDSIKPTLVLSSALSATYSTNIQVTATFSEAVTGFTAGDVAVTNAALSGFSRSGTTYTFRLTPSGQGLVTAQAAAGVALDGGGNHNTASNTLNVTYDTTRPTVTLSTLSPDPTRISPITVVMEFSEPVSGLLLKNISRTNAGKSNFAGSGVRYTFDLTPASQGLVTTMLAAGVVKDAAGNGNVVSNTLSINYDSIAPTVVFSTTASNPTNMSPIQVTATFSEPVTGFSIAKISRTNATKSNFAGSGTTYTFDLTPLAPGPVSTSLAADLVGDAAGNRNKASNVLVVNYQP